MSPASNIAVLQSCHPSPNRLGPAQPEVSLARPGPAEKIGVETNVPHRAAERKIRLIRD